MGKAALLDLQDDLFASIVMLLEAYRETAALILLYSGIDILGALDAEEGVATKSSFVNWSEKYMNPSSTLHCTGLELYSARCGLLHTMSPITRLTESGQAREFVYISYPPFPPERNSGEGPFVVHVQRMEPTRREGIRAIE